MEILYKKEHTGCFHHDKGGKPLIEVAKILKSDRKKMSVNSNEIVFVLEGKLKYTFDDLAEYEVSKGQLIFLHARGKYSCKALENVTIVVFRITKPMQFCDAFSIEKLYNPEEYAGTFRPAAKNMFSVLDMNPRLQHFIEEVKDCFSDGLRCQGYFEIKAKELFYLLRVYYTKEVLRDFFFLIQNEDTAFSEYIRLHWKRFDSIADMAESMQLSYKQFSKRFTDVFGEAPQKWIVKSRAQNIYNEITLTEKLFKQIAIENGLGSNIHLTWFCQKNFGKAPSDIRRLNKRI